MANAATRLVPFGELPAAELGWHLHTLIYSGPGARVDPRIAQDFPLMVPNFATPEQAVRGVEELVRVAKRSRGMNNFLAVLCDEMLIGMITCTHGKLKRKRRKGLGPFKSKEVLADGPLLACYLARPSHRPEEQKYLLPHVIRAAARFLVGSSSLHGRPWTLVQADRNDGDYVDNCLRDTNNGFGGFLVKYWGMFPEVDGVSAPRKLYVGQHNVESLRA